MEQLQVVGLVNWMGLCVELTVVKGTNARDAFARFVSLVMALRTR